MVYFLFPFFGGKIVCWEWISFPGMKLLILEKWFTTEGEDEKGDAAKAQTSMFLGSGCGEVGWAVASENSHRQFY